MGAEVVCEYGPRLLEQLGHHQPLSPLHPIRKLGPKDKVQDDRIQHVSILGTEERSVAEAICLKAVGNPRHDAT
jgi:hypothetical protein